MNLDFKDTIKEINMLSKIFNESEDPKERAVTLAVLEYKFNNMANGMKIHKERYQDYAVISMNKDVQEKLTGGKKK